MNNDSHQNFYLFRGNWYERFIELIDLVEVSQRQLIAVWTPKDKTKKHNLIIVNGAELPQRYCLDKSIWKTDEKVFESFYRQKMNSYEVHDNYYS
jgi:hypothetical protein